MKKRRSDSILKLCGEKIKYYRKAKGLSQEALGELLEMDFSQLGKIERGQTNITLSTLENIAVVLQIEPKVLLDF